MSRCVVILWLAFLCLLPMRREPAMRTETVYPLPDAVSAILRPPEDLTVSEWCDKHRHLDKLYCAEPGPWRTGRVPWIREIQDAFADPGVGSIIFVKGSRVSGTEAMNNMLAWSADCRPMPAMFVLPRKPDVHEEFGGRIRRIYEDSPQLARHIRGGNWATEDEIQLDTMTVVGAAANTEGDLIRRTVGLAFFDEVDNCQAYAGRLGNVWELIEKRLTTYGYRAKLVGVSTPSSEDATAWQEYQRSDGRQYFVPCPHCGIYQTLAFERLRLTVPEERDPDRIEMLDLMRYECVACKALLAEPQKDWMVQRGLWVPKTQKIEEVLDVTDAGTVAAAAAGTWRPSLAGEAPLTRRRGYWMNSLYSTLGLTWSKVFAQFLAVKDDRERYRVWVNQVLAQPWKETVVVTKIDELRRKTIGAAPEGLVPADAVRLIASADVQLHCLYYVIRAFGPNEESWLIRHGTCEAFEDFYAIAFDTEYPYGDGEYLSCTRASLDARYRRDEVLEFCERHDPEVIPTFGHESMDDRWYPKPTEFYPQGRRNPHSVMGYHINTSFFKTKLHRLIRQPETTPGGWHLHAETSEEYLQQLLAEELVWVKQKNARRSTVAWRPKREGMPNHYLDCESNALALADILGLRYVQPRSAITARRLQKIETQRQTGSKGLTTPDGRPYLVTRRR